MENKNKNCPEYSEAKDIGLAKHWMGGVVLINTGKWGVFFSL
ncbi:MAG: hypothetical protein PHQ48_08325 [Acidobacteriota bacterium]|nr:hypothetical protein [Acidobacteriota bacterium]MDY0231477.1 hypothetical protein [Candidatus Saccharicenans sp.]